MPGQHKRPPLSLRLPEADRAWVEAYAAGSGRPVHAVLVEAVQFLRLLRGGGPPGRAAGRGCAAEAGPGD